MVHSLPEKGLHYYTQCLLIIHLSLISHVFPTQLPKRSLLLTLRSSACRHSSVPGGKHATPDGQLTVTRSSSQNTRSSTCRVTRDTQPDSRRRDLHRIPAAYVLAGCLDDRFTGLIQGPVNAVVCPRVCFLNQVLKLERSGIRPPYHNTATTMPLGACPRHHQPRTSVQHFINQR